MFKLVEEQSFGAKIKVIGVGGGGGNALNTMISSDLKGVEFIAANTDSQALKTSKAGIKIQLGSKLTSGLGAGANPEVGSAAAIESEDEITEVLRGADMVFVTAGMGGGTGTGAAPIIARVARDMGALTVGVVTKPFNFEGKRRGRFADEGIQSLQESVDTLITIPNERLLQIAGQNMAMVDAFTKVDEILVHAVRGIADLITVNGLINLDFADVRTVMSEMGMALMGTGVAGGESRAIEAATRAISSPLLENVSMVGATGILLNICGGPDLTLFEVNEAAQLVQEEADDNANILFGAVIDENLGDQVRVTVIATGFQKKFIAHSTNAALGNSKVRPIRRIDQRATEDYSVAPTRRREPIRKEPTKGLFQAEPEETRTQTLKLVEEADDEIPVKKEASQMDIHRLVKEIAFSGSGQDIEPDEYDIPTFLRKHAD